jgi:LuxR family transcriptional regulator, maltose regulon positive regulatory protein
MRYGNRNGWHRATSAGYAWNEGNLFLVPLDDERIWYRYHHLFADLLKLLLEQEHPGLAVELHRRASCWYEAQGMISEAFQHALAAGDMELAARLVSEMYWFWWNMLN